MDESQARSWLEQELNVSRETFQRLEAFIALLRRENDVQNLVSRASLDHVWSRHIVDSAQLLRFAGDDAKTWLDLGTGAGFPGLIIAALHPAQVTMVEARKLRIDFLERAVDALGLPSSTRIICAKLERYEGPQVDVISARAFAPLPRLLDLAERFGSATTRWVLPKGKNAKSELEAARASWQGEFRLAQSLTDPDAQIIVAEGVRRQYRGKSRR